MTKSDWKKWLLNEFAEVMVNNWIKTGDCYEFEKDAKKSTIKKIKERAESLLGVSVRTPWR